MQASIMPHYADHVWHGRVTVEENVPLARDTYRVRFECPEIARCVVPGQFVMLRGTGGDDPLLGRPLAIYNVTVDGDGKPLALDIVYVVVGKMTRLLAEMRAGDKLDAWGPLGNGFLSDVSGLAETSTAAEHCIMVAGGIGQTPFLTLAREWRWAGKRFGHPPRAAVRGAQGHALLRRLARRDIWPASRIFAAWASRSCSSTDDGSTGHYGTVTELVPSGGGGSPYPCRLVCLRTGKDAARPRPPWPTEWAFPAKFRWKARWPAGSEICFSCVTKIRDAARASGTIAGPASKGRFSTPQMSSSD